MRRARGKPLTTCRSLARRRRPPRKRPSPRSDKAHQASQSPSSLKPRGFVPLSAYPHWYPFFLPVSSGRVQVDHPTAEQTYKSCPQQYVHFSSPCRRAPKSRSETQKGEAESWCGLRESAAPCSSLRQSHRFRPPLGLDLTYRVKPLLSGNRARIRIVFCD